MSAPPGGSERQSLAYYEAVPYLVVLESVERGGEWLRRAEHPELPGCVAEAPSALEALDRWSRRGSGCCGSCGTAARRSPFRGRPSGNLNDARPSDPGKEASHAGTR
jgi:hypothetical protein